MVSFLTECKIIIILKTTINIHFFNIAMYYYYYYFEYSSLFPIPSSSTFTLLVIVDCWSGFIHLLTLFFFLSHSVYYIYIYWNSNNNNNNNNKNTMTTKKILMDHITLHRCYHILHYRDDNNLDTNIYIYVYIIFSKINMR